MFNTRRPAHYRSGSRWLLCACVLIAGFGPISRPAGAQERQRDEPDRVVLQPEGSSSRIILSCMVLDYTGKQLTVRNLQDTNVVTYKAGEVVEVRTPQTAHHQQGARLFAEGEIERAQRLLELALAQESREWVRRDILALLIRCALRRGDYAAAGSHFIVLWQSDHFTPQVQLAPLTWGPRPLPESLHNEAVGWINRNDEAARLIGASHLLRDARHGQRAESELQDLASSIHRPIRLLARAQLWRLRLREGHVAPAELKRWQSRIEAMPEGIRGGPYYVLGRGRLARKEFDRAAMALLWLPLVYHHDTHLAARACLEAADALRQAGRQRESLALYREVTTKFAGTPYADEAATLLQSSRGQTAKQEPGGGG